MAGTIGNETIKAPAAKPRRPYLRALADGSIALVLALAASITLSSAPTSATPQTPIFRPAAAASFAKPAIADSAERPLVEIATTSSPTAADAIYGRTSKDAALLLLSLAISLTIAFNLAVFRHMRRAYATPRQPRVKTKGSR